MLQPNVLYSDDWHTNLSGGFLVQIPIGSYDLGAKELTVTKLAKDAAYGTAPTEVVVSNIEPVDNEPAVHQAIDAAVIA